MTPTSLRDHGPNHSACSVQNPAEPFNDRAVAVSARTMTWSVSVPLKRSLALSRRMVFPGPGNAPPQNWGHSKEFFGATPAERKASGFQPGDSCNGHSGFLVNPPPETP